MARFAIVLFWVGFGVTVLFVLVAIAAIGLVVLAR
jgi:hypothetical protein